MEGGAYSSIHHSYFILLHSSLLSVLNQPLQSCTLATVFQNKPSSLQTNFRTEEDYLAMPEVGDMAPDFELKSHLAKDKKVKLSDFRGQKNVVLAFYPLAWTPV